MKNKDRKNRKLWYVVFSVCIALLLTGSAARGQQVEKQAKQAQKHLAKEVLRFHVLANSDSKEDQNLKLEVRDAILSYMEEELPNAESAAQTKQWAQGHLKEIEEVADQTLKSQGCDDKAHAEVTKCYFPDKTYGDITFPEGKYEALRVKIGNAKGHNWWCVLYPNLCFIDSVHASVPEKGKKELKQVLSDDEYEMVTAASDFKIKWFFFGRKDRK